MTENEYREMLKDILDNGTEYEFKFKDAEVWIPFDITNCRLMKNYVYRKKLLKPVTWMDSFFPKAAENADDYDGTVAISGRYAIRLFYQEFLKRAYKNCIEVEDNDGKLTGLKTIYLDELEEIVKEMGVDE